MPSDIPPQPERASRSSAGFGPRPYPKVGQESLAVLGLPRVSAVIELLAC